MKLMVPIVARWAPILCAAFVSAAVPSTLAASPLEQIKSTTDKILHTLQDPALQGNAKQAERHRIIREELEQRFDWDRICQSCLGPRWGKLSAAQRAEFIRLFKDFLEHTYLDRIEPYYGELAKIDYQGERIVENQYASVRTVITTKQNIDHPVEYRLRKSTADSWQVYDVVIEGVSLVKNYRTQFEEILNRSSFQTLLDDLKTRAIAPPPHTTP